MPAQALPTAVAAFLDAVNARDAERLGQHLTDDMTYHLIVTHPPIRGREAVVLALRRVLSEADRVRWDVVSFAANDDLVFVERVDRFWYAGHEAAIECLGVFTLRDGKIAEVRDYADMETWRSRKAAATATAVTAAPQ